MRLLEKIVYKFLNNFIILILVIYYTKRQKKIFQSISFQLYITSFFFLGDSGLRLPKSVVVVEPVETTVWPSRASGTVVA